MPTVCVNPRVLKAAFKTVLQLVPNVGKIETRRGGVPTWIENARPKQAYWEIQLLRAARRGAGVGPQAWESPEVIIEGFMPLDYTAKTEDAWDDLITAVQDALITYPTLGNLVDGMRGGQLVQLLENRAGPYSDIRSIKEVHYCRISVTAERQFFYTVQHTLPT